MFHVSQVCVFIACIYVYDVYLFFSIWLLLLSDKTTKPERKNNNKLNVFFFLVVTKQKHCERIPSRKTGN